MTESDLLPLETAALDRLRARTREGTSGEAVWDMWREDARQMRLKKGVLLMDIRQLRREGALHGRDWHLQCSSNAKREGLAQLRGGTLANARYWAACGLIHRLCALNPCMTVMALAVAQAQQSTWTPEE